ncbi:MAG: phage portal protein [Roseovarius sp.]
MGLLDLFRARRRDAASTRQRSFEAATGSARRFNSGAASFGPWNSEIAGARDSVQRRARHFVANNALAHSGVSAWTTAAVGAGITATSQHRDPVIRRECDRIFRQWARDADGEGRTDFAGLQAMAVRSERIDGESVFVWQDDRLLAVPAEMLAMAETRDLGGGRLIANGVEIDADGRRVAYWIHPAKPTDLFPTYAPPARIEAVDVLHIFRPAGPGAVRGISALAPVLLRLAELDATEDAVQMGAKVAALLSVILTNENDLGSGDDPFSEDQSLEPGAMFKVPGGWKVNTTAPQQAQQVGEFLQHQTRAIAAGLDVPEHLLTGDLRNANYSSLRAALVSFRQKIEQFQFHVLVPQFLDPCWRRVMESAVLRGDLDPDPDLFRVEWIPPAQPWVDPLKDAEATLKLLGAGLMSRRQAVAALGYSVDELDAEIAADREREAALKLQFGGGADA